MMQSLVSFLKTKGIDVYIVTASNRVSSEIICWDFFGIPSVNVIGANVNIDAHKRISYVNEEIPYGEGKVNALKRNFNNKTLATGGDGLWDKYLLDYTIDDGIRLWLGQTQASIKNLRMSIIVIQTSTL